jgi:NitT/TauT family transport system ATP-binding protein
MVIKLDDVSKVFTTGDRSLTALHSISLTVGTGEFICLIGPSGCGKSTLLRLIADQLTPTSGIVTLNASTPGELRKHKGIAWMAQNPALLPWKTVRANIQLAQKINPTFNHPTLSFDDLLHLVDLAGFEEDYPRMLSGGMQQRVALARTLAVGASLWLMDEPFAALDEFTRESLANEVLNLWSAFSPTVIWVTHSIMEAVSMADRIIVLTQRPGRIKAVVPIQQPRPREVTHPYFLPLMQQLRELLKP